MNWHLFIQLLAAVGIAGSALVGVVTVASMPECNTNRETVLCGGVSVVSVLICITLISLRIWS